jgi:hypothetical protein
VLVTPGEVVGGRFEIERHVGAGGMGAIYRARDKLADRYVAVKIAHGSDPHVAARFAREAQALADLIHPAIVGYIAHGQVHGGALYLAMEWLDGEDLGTRLEVSRLSCTEAVACMQQAATALGIAHAKGIVHRDVKPSNLFLVDLRADSVKLLDFGVARFTDLDALTRTGALVGTPLYMSPEQVTGEAITARSDVFALGAVMFHCVTGRPPFLARNLPELVSKLVGPDEAPRARSLVPEIPRAIDEMIARMLAKDPAKRLADGAAVAAALEAGGIHEAAAIATAETGIVDPPASIAVSAAPLGRATAAMAEGRWHEARAAFEQAIAEEDTVEARMGLGETLWWLGDGSGHVRQLENLRARAPGRRAREDFHGRLVRATDLAVSEEAVRQPGRGSRLARTSDTPPR